MRLLTRKNMGVGWAAGGVDAATEQCSLVELGASDVVRGGGVEGDHRLLHLPISYAGASAGLWRELMGLSHEDERRLRDAGMTDLLRVAVGALLWCPCARMRARQQQRCCVLCRLVRARACSRLLALCCALCLFCVRGCRW